MFSESEWININNYIELYFAFDTTDKLLSFLKIFLKMGEDFVL